MHFSTCIYLQLFCNVYVCLTCVYNFVFQLIFPVIFLKSVLFCLFVQPINWYSPLFLSLLCFYGGEITQWKKDLPPSYEWERVWMIDVLILGEKRLNPLDIRISVVILPTNTAIHFLVPVIKKKKIWCYCYIELTPFSSLAFLFSTSVCRIMSWIYMVKLFVYCIWELSRVNQTSCSY